MRKMKMEASNRQLLQRTFPKNVFKVFLTRCDGKRHITKVNI